jgi:hypothetical protein
MGMGMNIGIRTMRRWNDVLKREGGDGDACMSVGQRAYPHEASFCCDER